MTQVSVSNVVDTLNSISDLCSSNGLQNCRQRRSAVYGSSRDQPVGYKVRCRGVKGVI